MIDFGKYKAALIDMDGVLFDSMPWHTLAWERMMKEAGVKCTRDEFYLYEGMTGRATIRMIFKREFGRDISDREADGLYAVKTRYFKEFNRETVMPHAQEVIAELGKKGLTRVLVTGSGQASLLDKLEKHYPGVFVDGRRVTSNDVTHGKPHPEPYLLGARLAGVSPGECLVIENAPLGVQAGKAAGCTVVAITTGPIPEAEMRKAGADFVFPSMLAFLNALKNE